jgi:kumamolisin
VGQAGGRLAAVALAAVLALAGCAGTRVGRGPARSIALAPVYRPPAQDLYRLLLRRSLDLGPVASRQRVSFLVALRNPSARQQQADLAAIYDPRSPRYGRFESLSQWAARSGPPAAGIRSVQQRLERLGLAGRWQRGGSSMEIAGPARVMARVFGVRVRRYRANDGQRFWASAQDPQLPIWLRRVVAGTGHLSGYAISGLNPAFRPLRLVPPNGLTPSDMLTAYNVRPLRQRGFDGSGQTIAFIEIDGYHQADLDAFTNHFGLPAMHPKVMYGSRLTDVSGETELDMEVAHEIAPGARLLLYNCSSNCSSTDIVSVEQAAARDNPRGVISVSLGGCEVTEGATDANAEKSAFDQADAQGESVLVASGDSGAFECLTEDWGAAPTSQYLGLSCPACAPSVTAVGGTRLSLSQNGTWYREEAWEDPLQTSGTGGGVSTIFGRPAWQTGPGTSNSFNTGNMREVPDVAADADPQTSAEIYVNGSFVEVGGTSQAVPIWAGIAAVMNQYLEANGGHAAGFLNPALYALASQAQAYPPFHDVVTGTNLYYPAGTGYDLATGLGTPNTWNLARDLARYEGK